MILNTFYTSNKIFQFVNSDQLVEKENIFTILVGKNGTGKSSLLSAIVRDLLDDQNQSFFAQSELGFSSRIMRGKSEITGFPEKIIALSTSPFDKFPITRRLDVESNYTYLGLRNLSSLNFGLAYMSKIISGLIESVIIRPDQATDLKDVLGYLGYNENIHALFSLSSTKGTLERIIQSDNPSELIRGTGFLVAKSFNRSFFYDDLGEIDLNKVFELVEVSKKFLNFDLGSRCNLVINTNGVNIEDGYEIFEQEILFLIRSGFLRLRNIGLESMKKNKIFSIKDASSGEQSVILSVLGIASKIQDNSLICIDEPEVCLHPEWQEKYMQILIATFSKYNNCHFIIATHSPQIISRLRYFNSFIMQIESGEVMNADHYINNSIDFQLANVFNSPGFKNEYLSRIALNIFTKVSRKKYFDEDDLEKLKLLDYQIQFMDNNDPVRDITEAIKEMYKIYG